MCQLKFEQLDKILRITQSALSQEKEFLAKLPTGLREWHVDNMQINAYYSLVYSLLNELCTDHDKLIEDIDWFLYEWPNLVKDKGSTEITITKPMTKSYKIENIDDYLKYVKDIYFSA